MFSPFIFYHASIHSLRCCHKFFLVELIFQSFNENNEFVIQSCLRLALFIFLREFSYKDSQTHLWSLVWSHRRNSSLLPKISFPIRVLKKFWSCILIPKITWCLFKNHIFNILRVNQATPSMRWLNYKQKKEKRKKK